MNKKKTTLKGFTLIELIIVLAIFSVIMTLVMSFIDPVSKLMTKTSVRERTSAYVDNINEYVSKSIRHAQNIWVYEKGLNGENEEDLVTDFVNTYYDGAVALEGTNLVPLNLKVHVLKLINEDEGNLKEGRIYESVYDLEAGKGIPDFQYLDKNTYKEVTSFPPGMTDDEKEANYIKCEARRYDGVNFKEASIKSSILNTPVINDEHFKDYSYYYKLGMYTFDPIKDSLDAYSDLTEDSNYFYSRLNKMIKNGSEISDGLDGYQVVMNVVSFTNEDKNKDNKYDNKIKSVHTIGEGSLATTEDLIAFKSPAAMNSIGITFKNVQLQKSKGNVVSYYRKKLEKNEAGNYVEKTEDGKTLIEPVRNDDTPDPFRRITDGTSDNIYIIFTVPSEIMDTKWEDSTPSEPEPEDGNPPKLTE